MVMRKCISRSEAKVREIVMLWMFGMFVVAGRGSGVSVGTGMAEMMFVRCCQDLL